MLFRNLMEDPDFNREFIDRSLALQALYFGAARHDIVDPSHKNIRIKGFSNEVRNTHLKSSGLSIRIFIRRQEDDRSSLCIDRFFIFAEKLQCLKSVDPRHLNIQQDQIRKSLLRNIVHHRLTGLQRCYAHIIPAQDMSCHLQVRGIIIHDHNPLCHKNPLLVLVILFREEFEDLLLVACILYIQILFDHPDDLPVHLHRFAVAVRDRQFISASRSRFQIRRQLEELIGADRLRSAFQ